MGLRTPPAAGQLEHNGRHRHLLMPGLSLWGSSQMTSDGLVARIRWTWLLTLGGALIDIIAQGHRRSCSSRSGRIVAFLRLGVCHIAVSCSLRSCRSIAAARIGQQRGCGMLPHVACAAKGTRLQFGCLQRVAQAISSNPQD